MDGPTAIPNQDKMHHSIVSEDGTLKYDFIISLQKIAMARIVSYLWVNQCTQLARIDLYRCQINIFYSHFFKIEGNISAKISQLLLPKSIRTELVGLVSHFKVSIVHWINYFNEHILNESKYYGENFIHNITWTTRGKIDHVQTAKNILVNSDNFLSDHLKYKLACTFCLEEEIALLMSKFENKFDLSYIMIDKHPMVYFWTAHITGDMAQLNNLQDCRNRYRRRGDISVNEHIIQLLIKNRIKVCDTTISDTTISDTPIKFMWNKLSKEEKAKNVALLFKNVVSSDCIMSVLSNLDYDLQQDTLKECSAAVLCAILSNWWWWGDYFLPTALNVLDIMDPLSFWTVLRKINEEKRKSGLKKMYDHFKSLFKFLYQKGSTQFKEFILHDTVVGLKEFVSKALDWGQDMDVIEVILKDLNMEQKKNIAFSEDGIKKCFDFIMFGYWNELDLFIKCTLSSEDDISQLKQKFIEDKGISMAIYLLSKKEFHKMEHFLNWAFKSEEDISNFRQRVSGWYHIVPSVAQ